MTAFDPLAHLPDNLAPTQSRITALVRFYNDNGRAPTEAEAVDLCGQPESFGATTDPLPDGFAGRDWRNPASRWLGRIRSRS